MKKSTKAVTLAAALAVGLGSVAAIAPSYAQDAPDTVAFNPRMAAQHFAGGGDRDGNRGGPAAHAQRLMETFDTDGDGVVTQEEIDAVRAAELAEFDADGDGTLSLEEYQALWLARVYERMVDDFQKLDADGDGQITVEEFNAMLANIVERLDQNGDGGLGEGDRPERGQDQRPDGAGQPGPGQGPGGPRR